MRKLDSYVARYGPEFGPKFYHALQSQAAHAGVSARLRRKIEVLTGRPARSRKPGEAPAGRPSRPLPLFPEPATAEA